MEQATIAPRSQAKSAAPKTSDAKPKAFDINGNELPCIEEAAPNSWGEDNWLLKNPEALAALDRGLAQSAAGHVYTGPSYAQYADVEIEE